MASVGGERSSCWGWAVEGVEISWGFWGKIGEEETYGCSLFLFWM